MQKSLPQRPRLEQLRRQAKDLLKELHSGKPDAVGRLRESGPEIDVPPFKLSQAQFVIAREYGFESWPKLKRQVELLALDERERIDTFVTSALMDHNDPKAINFERSRALLRTDPAIPRSDFHAALVAGEEAHRATGIVSRHHIHSKPDQFGH
jgi:hypothetical protein